MWFRSLFCLLCLLSASLAWAAPARYSLDSQGSEVRFTYTLGGVDGAGTMPVSTADIVLDFDNASASRTAVTLNPGAAKTSAGLITSTLKSKDVLNTDQYPEIQFVSRSVTAKPGGAVVTGDVTVRGVTRPLTLQATIYRPEGSAPGDRSRLTVRLTGAINRHDFGASGYPDLVDDTVTLDIRARLRLSD